MRIAFFDSGIGGLTVLRDALRVMPDEAYLYYADTKNVPYGIKPKEEVRNHILASVEFLSAQNIGALVVACNTATSVAINDLRERFDFPILGMEPAIKPAIVKNSGKKILVLATSLTLKESKLETLISKLDKNQRIKKAEMDKLITFAERFEFDSMPVQLYLQEKLGRIKWDEYETVVLGCTHFIYYRGLIQGLCGSRIKIIDGNEGTVNNLVNTVGKERSPSGDKEKRIVFYSSGVEDAPARVKILQRLLR